MAHAKKMVVAGPRLASLIDRGLANLDPDTGNVTMKWAGAGDIPVVSLGAMLDQRTSERIEKYIATHPDFCWGT